jgi:hypothetical protein
MKVSLFSSPHHPSLHTANLLMSGKTGYFKTLS